ncbi:MAG: hypothetical protein H7062_06210 [Candidatus Saccharimonas sp.]|nr:hypothetical protein [Planctomycetaceae bacterium]
MNRLELIARLALELAGRELPEYSHPKSPKKFTQPQLLACLVLRTYQKSVYRGTEDQLDCADQLQRVLRMKAVPDHSTLQKFADRVAVLNDHDGVAGEVGNRSVFVVDPKLAIDRGEEVGGRAVSRSRRHGFVPPSPAEQHPSR